MITINIAILDNGSRESARLIIGQNEITFKYAFYSITKEGNYPFVVLREIRRELDKENVFLLINGSRKDVYPSGLSLNGNNAYVQTLGKPTSLNDLVDIFSETNNIKLISTVADQEIYHKEWVNSIRG